MHVLTCSGLGVSSLQNTSNIDTLPMIKWLKRFTISNGPTVEEELILMYFMLKNGHETTNLILINGCILLDNGVCVINIFYDA